MSEPRNWKKIICRGFESDELDYKAAQNWQKLSRAGRAKFARHCMAMANTKGGFIVVGVGEDPSGKPALFTGLTEEESSSFDPTEVGTFVSRFSDPPVHFTLERPVVDGKTYAVFDIRRFEDMPHVCTSTCEGELQQGAFYIRTVDASSRPAYRASEVHDLVRRAMRNQREILGRMLRGILYEEPRQNGGFSSDLFQDELHHSRSFFSKHAKDAFLLELWSCPDTFRQGRFTISELKKCAEISGAYDAGSLFFPPEALQELYATNVSLRSFEGNEVPVFREFFQSGLFHFSVIPGKDAAFMDFPFVRKCMQDAFAFLGNFYAELGLTDELLHIHLRCTGTENMLLTGIPGKRKNEPEYRCRIPEITLELERSCANLSSAPLEHADYFFKRFCERFNLPEDRVSWLFP